MPFSFEEYFIGFYRGLKDTPRRRYLPLSLWKPGVSSYAGEAWPTPSPGLQYFSIQEEWGAIAPPLGLDVLIYSACGPDPQALYDKRVDMVAIPHLPTPQTTQTVSNSTRDLLLSFASGKESRSFIGQLIHSKLETPQGVLVAAPVDVQTRREIAQRSTFSLCPADKGLGATLISEALSAGSIPIYVYEADPWLPWSSQLNFNDFGAAVHVSQLDTLVSDLRALPENDIKAAQNLINTQLRGMNQFRGCAEWIVSDLCQREGQLSQEQKAI